MAYVDTFQEHCDYEANAAYDYHSELWASEEASMADEAEQGEIDWIVEGLEEATGVDCSIAGDYSVVPDYPITNKAPAPIEALPFVPAAKPATPYDDVVPF